MLRIIIIGSLFILIFSIIGVTYFRGMFYRCDFLNVPSHYMYLVENKWDCMDYGGEWVNPYPNFDNIKSSFILFFEMMTTENWTFYVYSALDATGFDRQPVHGSNGTWAIFFVIYMIFAYFFLLNLAISILADNFKKEKNLIENSDFVSPVQKEFFKIFQSLYKLDIPKKIRQDKLSKILLNILDSIYFDVIITACIISNLLVLMMKWPGIDERTKEFISNMNIIFNYVFIFEAVLKIYVYRVSYFKSGWNILDFIIVCDGVINILLKSLLDFFNNVFDSSILRTIRVARILRIIKRAQSLNRVFNLFINSIPGVMNIGILYLILVFFYAILGMTIFSSLKYQVVIGEKWNFKEFIGSIILLIRVTSGEGWNIIMHECARERSGTFYCKYYDEMSQEELISKSNILNVAANIGCGGMVAIPYFMSFVVLSSMMFLEFFAVIIASTVNDTYVINLIELKKAHINKFKQKWALYDKQVI
jgi:hypothetical protein